MSSVSGREIYDEAEHDELQVQDPDTTKVGTKQGSEAITAFRQAGILAPLAVGLGSGLLRHIGPIDLGHGEKGVSVNMDAVGGGRRVEGSSK